MKVQFKIFALEEMDIVNEVSFNHTLKSEAIFNQVVLGENVFTTDKEHVAIRMIEKFIEDDWTPKHGFTIIKTFVAE